MTNEHNTPAPKPAVEPPEPAPDTGSTDRARRREAALRRLERTSLSKRTAAVLGLGTAAAVSAITVAGSLWSPTPPAMDTAARAAELPATPVVGVCPGAPALPEGAGSNEDLDFSPLSSDAATALTVTAGSDLAGNIPGISYFAATPGTDGPGSAQDITEPLDEELQQGPPATAATDGTVRQLAHYDAITDPSQDGQPVALAVEPVGGNPGLAAATAQYAATDGDLAGMTTGACTPAAHQHWLTGAITTTGTTAVLSITNPSATNSTVDLAVFGDAGRIEASGASGIVLAPGQTTSMLVAGLAPRQESVAIEVSTSGGPVAASIQQHRLDGIVPAGVDTLQPAATGTNVVVPGIVIDDDAAAISEGSGLDGQTPQLHIASTGAAASATISLRGPDGPVDIPAEASAVELAPGATTTVDLTGVEPGTYAVAIESDANILASATSLAFNPAADNDDATGNTAAVDTAYQSATRPIRGETMVALPALGSPASQLVLSSDADATVNVTPINADGDVGETREQEIAANSAVTVTDDAATAYLIETGSSSVHAGVVTTSDAGISAMPVNTVTATGSGLPVRLGY
ncbi:DUF5719 family protein [Enteractinococcus helveticum]|uniref:Large extracellular alpha-helical protein n=1 Tax=Enteractinococcus helveticum TaxID=1837282 RepID=A0A1B7LY63_9MICC|nr:DUF5719 family protein [Enteractinococcus helveticum]OAV60236.1 hypothetical protein A6F49_12710 [Enteractinococcus helveticum]